MTDEQISRIATYAARKSYPAWGDLPGLHPAAHLLAATALFEEGFFWIDMGTDKLPREEFSWAMTALRRAKAAAAEERWASDTLWQKISKDPVYRAAARSHRREGRGLKDLQRARQHAIRRLVAIQKRLHVNDDLLAHFDTALIGGRTHMRQQGHLARLG